MKKRTGVNKKKRFMMINKNKSVGVRRGKQTTEVISKLKNGKRNIKKSKPTYEDRYVIPGLEKEQPDDCCVMIDSDSGGDVEAFLNSD